MFKTLLLACALLAASPCFATFYVGGSLGVQNTGPYSGLFVNGFGGFEKFLGARKFYHLAGEIFADSGTLPLSQNYYERSNYGLGISILPGMQLNSSTLFYGRIGVETFRLSNYLSYRTGGQLGIGIQTDFTESFDLRAEFVYTGRGIFEGFGVSQYRIFRLGLVYSFI